MLHSSNGWFYKLIEQAKENSTPQNKGKRKRKDFMQTSEGKNIAFRLQHAKHNSD